MEDALIEQLKNEIRYEFSREGPPEGFPKFPDIPGGRYTDPEFFALEQKYLWPRTWLMAGRQEDLPEVGSYWIWDSLRDTPVVLVRDADRRIRAFRDESPNNAPLVPWQDDSHLRTEVEFDAPGKLFRQQHFPRRTLPDGVLRCQRRGWAYDTNGHLVDVPFGEQLDAIPYEDRTLTEYRCEVWGGWVFVNQDPDAMPLIEWLGPIARQMAQFQGENLRLFEKDSLVISCNWKVTVEAFQEVYHFKHIHQKEGVTMLDQRGATMGLFPHGHSRMITPITKRAATASGMEDRPRLEAGRGHDGWLRRHGSDSRDRHRRPHGQLHQHCLQHLPQPHHPRGQQPACPSSSAGRSTSVTRSSSGSPS